MIRHQAERIWRAWERRRAARQPHGVILIYHRVATPATDPWGIAVSPENFAAHMEMLRSFAVPRTLGDFAGLLETAKGPERSIVVTFDDGYADNLDALPVLDANEVSATIFIVSRAVGHPQAFWWDLLTRIFLETPVLPRFLTLDAGGERLTYDLGDVARYGPADIARVARWRADNDPPEDARQRTYLDVWQHLLALPPDEIMAAAESLARWAGLADAACPDGTGRPVTSEELAWLADSPLIEIGGHTRTHADLSRLSREEAADEIGGGRRELMEMTGREIRSFAYPYGRSGPRTISDIRSAGFTCASWSRFGLATTRSDPYALPRVHVPNLSPSEFERLLGVVLGPAITPRRRA